MNETLKIVAERFSCRDFKDTPVTDEQMQAILKAALAAPSGGDSQPWQIVVVGDKALIEEYDADGMGMLAAAEDKMMYDRMMSRGGKLLYNAPCLVLILSDGLPRAAMDCGILSQTMAIAAGSIGLNSCIVGLAGLPLVGPNGEDYKKRMKFKDGFEFAIGILLGTANTSSKPHDIDMGKITYV